MEYCNLTGNPEFDLERDTPGVSAYYLKAASKEVVGNTVVYGTGIAFKSTDDENHEVLVGFPCDNITNTCFILQQSPMYISDAMNGREIKVSFVKVRDSGREYKIGDKILCLLVLPRLDRYLWSSMEEVDHVGVIPDWVLFKKSYTSC